jgi:hypothetical protein
MRLCPPSNRTAEPVKHPLIPMTGCVFMACPLLLCGSGEEKGHGGDGNAEFLHLGFVEQCASSCRNIQSSKCSSQVLPLAVTFML